MQGREERGKQCEFIRRLHSRGTVSGKEKQRKTFNFNSPVSSALCLQR